MATSILPSSPFTNASKAQACLRTDSITMCKATVCFTVHLQYPNCSLKLCQVPSIIDTTHHYQWRTYAGVGSPPMTSLNNGSSLETGASFPDSLQRSESLRDNSSNANGFEKQLQELFAEIKTLISAGKKSDAIYLLKANYEAVKERIDASFRGVEEVAVLDIIALGYMAVGDVKMVGSILNLMGTIVDDLDDDGILGSALLHMGSMYSVLKKFDKSILMYERARNLFEKLYGRNSTFVVTPLLGAAKALSYAGKASKAVENYHQAIAIIESGRGVDSLDLTIPLSGLGNLLISEGKAKDAEDPFTRILNIYIKLYGESDGRVGMALCSLANAKCAQGNADEAIHLYRKALQIIRDSGNLSLDDKIMEKMRIDLAELLHVVGRRDEGRKLLEECLVITEKYKGKEHPGLATHLINLAISYSTSSNFVEAERLLRTSLRIMTKNTEPDDPSITFPMMHLAITLYNLKRDKEAERIALEVLRIREAAFGKESLPVGEALDCLVSIQVRLGEDDENLLELLKRVLRIQEKEFGYDTEEVMVTLKKIIFYLDKLGRRDEKFPIQRRLSVLREKFKYKVHY